jgi:hypothetical protein
MFLAAANNPVDITIGDIFYAFALFCSVPVGIALLCGVVWVITFPFRELYKAWMVWRNNR